METLPFLMLMYLVPAGILVGITFAVVWKLRRPEIHRFEYVSWVLPGLTYWLLFSPLGLEQAFRGKSMSNLVEPVMVGGIAAAMFVARAVIGARHPRWNRAAAVVCVLGSNLAAAGVFVLMPSLPE